MLMQYIIIIIIIRNFHQCGSKQIFHRIMFYYILFFLVKSLLSTPKSHVGVHGVSNLQVLLYTFWFVLCFQSHYMALKPKAYSGKKGKVQKSNHVFLYVWTRKNHLWIFYELSLQWISVYFSAEFLTQQRFEKRMTLSTMFQQRLQ